MKTRIIFLALMIASFVTTQMAVTGAAGAAHNTSRGGWAGVTTLTGRTQSAMRANVSLSAQSLQTDANTLDFTTISVCDSLLNPADWDH